MPIYIGEFSCIRWAPNNSAYNYIRDCIEIFEEYNWDYDYYSFQTWNGWSVEHSTGYYDNVFPTTKTDRELLLRSYFRQNLSQVQFPESNTLSSKFYPNPVKDDIYIKTENLKYDYGVLEIVDIQGRLKTQKLIGENKLIKVDVSSFSDGMYFYTIKNEKGEVMVSEKFIKY